MSIAHVGDMRNDFAVLRECEPDVVQVARLRAEEILEARQFNLLEQG